MKGEIEIEKFKKGDKIMFEYSHDIYEAIVIKDLKYKILFQPVKVDNYDCVKRFDWYYINRNKYTGDDNFQSVNTEIEKRFIKNIQKMIK